MAISSIIAGFRRPGLFAVATAAAALLAGCTDEYSGTSTARSIQPLSPQMLSLMSEKGTNKDAPLLIRTYKKEAELEVWKMGTDGRYALLKTYPMCRWSGQLGPKTREGDRQVPEGFYTISPGQMNPNSAYYLSFNVGYPNAYDRAYGRTGGSIMVHGVCSSAGCFSMTDQQIAEIYSIARDSFAGGQHAIQMQSYPFKMTAENLAKYRVDPNIGFWKQLKEGADNFEVTKQDVAVGVCNRRYVFNATAPDGTRLDPTAPCPTLKTDPTVRADVTAKATRDEAKVAELVAQGVPAVHTVYADGGQNAQFASLAGDVSRPDALAQGPTDVLLKEKGKKTSPLVQVAAKGKAAAGPQLAKVEPVTTPEATATAPAAHVETASAEPSTLSRWFAKKAEPAADTKVADAVPAIPTVETPAKPVGKPAAVHHHDIAAAKPATTGKTDAPKAIAVAKPQALVQTALVKKNVVADPDD
jgi:murein L,D-transpeptidase YafK